MVVVPCETRRGFRSSRQGRADHSPQPEPAPAPAPARQAPAPAGHRAASSPTSLSLHSTPQTHSHCRFRPSTLSQELSPGSPLRARDIMRHDRAPFLQRRQLPGLEVSARGWYVTMPPDARVLSPASRFSQNTPRLDACRPAPDVAASSPSLSPPPPRAPRLQRGLKALKHQQTLILKRLRQSSAGAGA